MSKAVCLIATLVAMSSLSLAEEQTVYVGTYTNSGESEGIYALQFDSESGALTNRMLAAKTQDPSFLALHQNGKHLYAVNETGSGELSSFKIDPATHKLEFINERPSGGGAPCHLVIDQSGTSLLVANYSGGNVSVTRINDNGSLGPQTSLIQHEGSSINKRRQQEPHAHSINLDANSRFAVVADLGTDELVVYRFDPANGMLTPHGSTKLPPGSGPRHFAFHPGGSHAYAINELLSTVTALEYDSHQGTLKATQTITTLPRDYQGNSHTAEVVVSPNGKFVYGSNRGHDSIAVFRVKDDSRLTLVQIEPIHGKAPRNFCLAPSGRFLLAAGQGSNVINVFKVDQQTGKLTKTGHSASVPKPVCIRFAK